MGKNTFMCTRKEMEDYFPYGPMWGFFNVYSKFNVSMLQSF